MSKLDELIQQLCPEGVEWQTLNDIGEFFGGLTGKSKNDFIDGNAAFITYSNIYSNPSLNLNIDEKVRIDDGEKQNVIQYGDILFTGSSETPEECGMSSVVTKEPTEKMYLNSFCFGLRLFELDKFNFDYLKHLFRSTEIRKEICKTANGVTRFNVSKKKMGEIAIPLPPLPVQEEIVRILDQLTETTQKYQAELEAELATRKKQYEEYRNQLLDLEGKEGVEMKMSNFCILKAGKSIKAEDIKEFQDEINIYPCFGGNGIRGYVSYYSHDGEYPIIGRQGALCGCVNWAKGKFYATEHAVVAKGIGEVSQRFLFKLFDGANLNQYKTQGAQPGLSVTKLNELFFKIPPLAEQERIVNILDRMEKTH